MRYRYDVVASYRLDRFCLELDNAVRAAARRDEAGSGAGSGRRDIHFVFRQKEAAKRALARIQKIKGVKATLDEEDEYAES